MQMMREMYRATIDTRHFEWEAFGTTEEEARKYLAHALRKHTEFTPSEIRELMEDAHAYPIRAGLTLRDRTEVN